MTSEEALGFAQERLGAIGYQLELRDRLHGRSFYEKQEEMLIQAIAALRENMARDNPQPLTLDELIQMDGEPVWINDIKNPVFNGWHLVSVNCEDDYVMDRRGWEIPIECLDCDRIAYRYPPKEVKQDG